MKSDWPTTRAEFCKLAACEGVRKIAERVPADPVTVYRIMSGETQNPSRAVRENIERLVKETKHKP